MKLSLAILTSITFALTACAAMREEQVASEGVILPAAMCAKDGRTVSMKSRDGKTLNCAMESTVGSRLRDCVCRGEEEAADRAVALVPVRQQETGAQTGTK
jgi:hypothetical protein